MIYDGKKASLLLQNELRAHMALLPHKPVLAVLSVSSHPSIASFIKIKRKFAEAIGVIVKEYNFSESDGEESLIKKIQMLVESNVCDGIIVQLPLPKTFDTNRILDTIPENLDTDVLGFSAWNKFMTNTKPVPPVAGAIAHILDDTKTNLTHKKVVIIGYGKLVGQPLLEWFIQEGCKPELVTIDTSEETQKELYREADIVVSGIGSPHHLKKEFFKEGVILIDAGTSEQAGVLAGDCDPECRDKASVFTPVPGGVGPLTVAFLFKNLITSVENSTINTKL